MVAASSRVHRNDLPRSFLYEERLPLAPHELVLCTFESQERVPLIVGYSFFRF